MASSGGGGAAPAPIHLPRDATLRDALATAATVGDWRNTQLYGTFHWHSDAWPLRDFVVPLGWACLYLVVIFALRAALGAPGSGRPAARTKLAATLHNIVMIVISAYMMLGTAYQVAIAAAHDGMSAYELFCDPHKRLQTSTLMFYCYVFYVSKYYEFVDTLLLVVKRKPLSALHVWHHFSTVMLCYAGVNGGNTYTWLACFQNTLVHTLMYTYYLLTLYGVRPRWKRMLTVMQMLQFWLNMAGVVGWMALQLADGWKCAGDVVGWSVCLGVNLSFYVLFQLFYNRTYSADGADGDKQKQKQKKQR